MKKMVRVFIVMAVVLLAATTAWAESFTGRVVGISDGDTITVLASGNRQVKVRLYGVDCPESKQAFGTRARQFTSSQVGGKIVQVHVEDRDRYGRTVGIVTTQNGKVLNRELLAQGFAWLYSSYCKASFCRDWKALEQKAKKARLGLWADKSPIPPWEFRRAMRSGSAKAQAPRSQAYVTSYSGNTSSGIFHAPSCRYFHCKRCTATFTSREAAIQAGYRPCKICRP